MKRILLLWLFLCGINASQAQQTSWGLTFPHYTRAELFYHVSDADGNIYSAGAEKIRSGIFSVYPVGDLFITKRNSEGTLLWTRYWKGTGRVFQMFVDHDNNLLVSGASMDSLIVEGDTLVNLYSHTASALLVKLDSSGHMLWLRSTSTPMQSELGLSVAVDASNHIYWLGMEGDINVFFRKFSVNGDMLWAKPLANSQIRSLCSISIDEQDRIFITGNAPPYAMLDSFDMQMPQETGYILFLASADSSGKILWMDKRNYGTFDFTAGVVARGGKVYWNYDGGFANDGVPIEIHQYEPSGKFLKRLEIPLGAYFDQSQIVNTGFAVREDGRLILLSKRYDTLDVYAIDSSLLQVSPFRFSLDGRTMLNMVISAAGDDVIISGQFYRDSVTVGGAVFYNSFDPAKFEIDVFMLKASLGLSTTGFLQVKKNAGNYWYPNPASGTTRLRTDGLQGELRLDLSDITGRKILTMSYPPGASVELNLDNLLPGLYITRLLDEQNQVYMAKLVVN